MKSEAEAREESLGDESCAVLAIEKGQVRLRPAPYEHVGAEASVSQRCRVGAAGSAKHDPVVAIK